MWFILGAIAGGVAVVVGIWLTIITTKTYH